MRKELFPFAAALVGLLVALSAQALTDQQAAALSVQFMPPAVAQEAAVTNPTDSYLQEVLANPLQQIQFVGGHLRYLAFIMPGDASSYVLLAWASDRKGVYWRLLKSTDGGTTYAVAQDSGVWYQPFEDWNLRLQDITGDGVPELFLEEVGDNWLTVFGWREGQWVLITPNNTSLTSSYASIDWSALWTSEPISLEDLDGDGVDEIVVPPFFENIQLTVGGDFTEIAKTPTRIYKYNGSAYTLWKEIPWSDSNPYPVNVPGFAVVHPGTIPLSELQGGGGNGQLQVFVTVPQLPDTVDGFDPNGFACNGTALSVTKRWPNQKQPNTSYANNDWMGCPVRQEPVQSQGDWNPPPEDPFVPSPDGKTEYHFVGPYLELRLPKSAVYPMLLQQATDAFTKDPSRQTYFLNIPITGKMTNGKLAAIAAMICIKNTGASAKATKETVKPSPAVSPAPPAGEKPKK